MLEVPAALTFTLTVEGLAVMVKSWTMNVTVTEWDREPLVPVTATCTVLAGTNVHDRVELPEPVTLVGERVQAVLLEARLTMPEKPFWPVTVIVDVPAALALTVTVVGLAAIVKSVAV